jgi:hypothetical protein
MGQMSSHFEWQKLQTKERVDARLKEGKVQRDVKEARPHFLAMVAERRRKRAERRQRGRERLLAEAAAVLQREPEAKEESWLERLAFHRRR